MYALHPPLSNPAEPSLFESTYATFPPFCRRPLINVDTESEHNNNRDFPSHLFFSSIIPVQLQADSQSNPTKHNNTTECRHESSEYCVAFTTQE